MGQTVDWQRGRPYNLTFFGDYRHYLRLTQRSCLAVRLMGRHSRGDVPEYASMGGSWTLRGYPWRSIWGHHLVLCNQELRFPLLDRLVLAFPFGDLDLSAFRGALFVDAGNAWSDAFGRWKGSLGGGARLALGGVFVFRLDGSRRTDFHTVGNDTHYDFFFGWDF
jgi:outer membrane protein assembly factor BamA